MPQLPQYTAQRNINAQAAAPMRDETAFPFQLTQQIAGVMGEINQKMMQARDVMEYTEAKAKYEVATADIQARAAQDMDFNNAGSYVKELQEVRKASLTGVKNKQMAERAALEFDYGGQVAAIKINAGFHTKQLEHNKKSLEVGVNTLMQKSMSSGTAAERANTQMAIDELIQLNVSNGTITEFEAGALLYDAKKNVAMFDAQYNPEKFLANKKEYGLNTSDMADATSKANEFKKKIKEEQIEIQNEAQKATIIDYVTTMAKDKKKFEGQSITEIMNDVNNGLMPKEFGNAMIKAKMAPDLRSKQRKSLLKGKDPAFIKMIDNIMDADTDEDIISAMTFALNAKGEGKIPQDELDIIMMSAVDKFEKKDNGLVALFKKLKGALKGYETGGDILFGLIRGVTDGKSPEDSAKEAITDANNKAISVGEAIKTHQEMLSPDGMIYRIPLENVAIAIKEGFEIVE